MHEEATSMSVPGSVAASTAQNENGTSTVSVVNADVDLEAAADNDNAELQVPFATNSGGKWLCCRTKPAAHFCRLSDQSVCCRFTFVSPVPTLRKWYWKRNGEISTCLHNVYVCGTRQLCTQLRGLVLGYARGLEPQFRHCWVLRLLSNAQSTCRVGAGSSPPPLT